MSKLEDLFNILVKESGSKKFANGLHEWQKEFCKKYDEKGLSQKQIFGINIPTGFGKTLIGLLIGKISIVNGKTCAIITQTRALVDRVADEAKELGIEYVIIPSKKEVRENRDLERVRNINEKKFSHAQAIRISTYDLELYSDLKPAQVLIIDDADMFVNNLQKKSSIIISRDYYSDLYESLYNELNKLNYDDIEKIFDRVVPENEFRLLTANDSIKIQNKFLSEVPSEEMLRGNLDRGDDLYYKMIWRENKHLKNYFPHYLTFINSEKIIFQLLFPDPEEIRKLSESNIILMSATLGKNYNSFQEFGLKEPFPIIDLKDLNIKNQTMGKRIIFPLSFDDYLDNNDYGIYCDSISDHFNKVLFLMYTKKEAEVLQEKFRRKHKKFINYIKQDDVDDFLLENDSNLLSIGRYIGLDLPIPQSPLTPCQVVVLTRIPYYTSHFDYLFKNICGRQELFYDLIARKLIQSFGRCNRNKGSKGVYFIIDPELNENFRRKKTYAAYFPTNIFSEIDKGFDLSVGGEIEDAIESAKNFLLKDDEKESNKIVANNQDTENPDIILNVFPHELNAWNSLVEHNFIKAKREINNAINEFTKAIEDGANEKPLYQSWLYYLKCVILECDIDKYHSYKDIDELKKTQNDLSLISKNIFFNRYIHQNRADLEVDKEEEEESTGLDSIHKLFSEWLMDPKKIFSGTWDSEIMKTHKENIKNSLNILSQGLDEEGLKTLLPELEAIIREITSSESGDDCKSLTLSDLINLLKSKNLICLNTSNSFHHLPNSIGEIRNTILHGLKSLNQSSEALNLISQVINGLRFVINDIYFVKMLDLIKGDEIKTQINKPNLNLLTGPQLKEKIKKSWLNSEKNFDPDPSIRENPLFYSGDVVFKKKNSIYGKYRVELDFLDLD